MHILSLTVSTTSNFKPHGEPNLIIFSDFHLYSNYKDYLSVISRAQP